MLKDSKLKKRRQVKVCKEDRDGPVITEQRPGPARPSAHGYACEQTHMSQVTGHKEPLCQVTEHREKDIRLEGCDMTNMSGV